MKRKNKRRQILFFAAACLCILALAVFAFQGRPLSSGRGLQAASGEEASSPGVRQTQGESLLKYNKALKPRTVPDDWEFTIISTGDIMMHSPQTKAGLQRESGGYDFSFMFEKVAPILREGDLVIGNLETPLAGEANGGFTGYPMFNAPEILAKNLKDAGFTLVSTANNHSLDRGFKGLCATLDHLDGADLAYTGTFRSQEEREQIAFINVKGVRIAVIAATYGSNGIKLPAANSYALNYIHEETLLEEISRARAEGAQYVILMFHWGVEYQSKPNKDQTTLAANLLRGGADLILGNHPHVLQMGEMVSLSDLYEDEALEISYKASGKDRQKFVMYSQGNFVSNQEGLERLCSILLKLTIGVDGATGEPYLKEAGYVPIYTQKRNRQGSSKHMVWPLEVALAELEAGGQPFNGDDRANLPKAWDHVLKSQPALDLLSLQDKPLWALLFGLG